MRALAAAAGYLAVTILMTWPLPASLARDIPWDLGDSLLNLWILGWSADHLLRFLTGDFRAFVGYWNGNFFYPAPLVLAYSEHMFAQAIQILPVYATTGNLVLCYNLLFLSTFVLSGLGTFLLVRNLTGHTGAAFVAGLIFAFAPYRIAQFSHLQVLSSQWMPFVLFGFRRFFETRRLLPLAGATVALVAQNLSCGYFLVFFTPFVVAYVIYEIAVRGLLRDWRTWALVAGSGVLVALATMPFLLPYLALRNYGFAPRSLPEVEAYAADVYAWLTAHVGNRLWGTLQVYFRAEGELFPSFTAPLLAVIGIASHLHTGWKRGALEQPARPDPRSMGTDWPLVARRVLIWLLAVVAVVHVIATVLILTGAGGLMFLGPIEISIKSFWRVVFIALGASAGFLMLSARARALLREFDRMLLFSLFAAAAATLLSFGPTITTLGRFVATGPYIFLYRWVPGFDGLRAPARFGMVTVLFLAIAAGFGAAWIGRRRGGTLVLTLCGLLFLAESTAVPVPLNVTGPEPGLADPPARVPVGDAIPPVYRFLATLPPDAAIAHFPFGATAYELRYVYLSTAHWRRVLNGYSGHFPKWHAALSEALSQPLTESAGAWDALQTLGATHAVVHRNAFLDGDAERVSAWLRGNGAELTATVGGDDVFRLRRDER